MFPISPLPLVLQITLAILVMAAAAYDYRFRRIPNWLSVGGLTVGLALNLFLGGFSGLGRSGLGFLVGFAVYFLLYVLHAMGAGDVKLMGAVEAISGPDRWFTIFLLTSIAGGVTALLLMVHQGRVRRTFWNVGFIASEMMRFRAPHLSRAELDVNSATAVTLPAGIRVAIGVFAFHTISTIIVR